VLVMLILMISLAPGLVVEGPSACPTPKEVAEQLAPLLPEELSHPERVLILSGEQDRLVLELTSRGGQVLARRSLPRNGSCGVQAKRVAVVAAAWQAEIDDEPLPPPPKIEPEAVQLHSAPLEPRPAPRSPTTEIHLEMGLRTVTSPGPSFQFEIGIGKSWGRFGLLGNVEGPSPAVLFGPTMFLLEGYPTVALRAQAAVALGEWSGGGSLAAIPGAEVGVRVTMGSSGPRGFVDLCYAHYFGDSPPPNQAVLTIGLALGGAG
jgi:hypothetical protein